MSQKEIVSVVIPAYNAANFIEDAVKSCFNQVYRPIEVIVVNDGSTDSTVDVVNALSSLVSENQLELRIIDIGLNKGAANALNVGFSNAKGAFICWLSADDVFINREKIEKQVTHMSRTTADWSYFRDFYSGLTLSDANLKRTSYLPRLRIIDPLFIRNNNLRLMMLLFRNPINGSSIMIRRESAETYGSFDPITRNVDGDGDLWMRYSALRLKLSTLKGAPVFYRGHPSQTSKKKELMMYGSELTRMRMLLTLEKKGNLMKLIKIFIPYFPIILRSKLHFERPFVSEFLFDYILDNKGEFNRVFLKYIKGQLNGLRRHKNYLLLDRKRFLNDLELFMESHTFKEFEKVFLKMMVHNEENNSSNRR